MDKTQIKNLQKQFTPNELEEMIKPDESLSASERLRQSIKNKQLRRAGLHTLKRNLQTQMDISKIQSEMKKQTHKSNLDLLLESVCNTSLKRMRSKNIDVSAEEYARCLSILSDYLHSNASVNNIDQIPEFEKIDKDNIRNVVHKIAYYDKYNNTDAEEVEL